jgi:NAD(P)-dependent dehydrogenase (short-subunit alcohol dehydrogenase family)
MAMSTGPEAASRKVAVVTAAGRGIGAACARELHGQGYQLSLMSLSDRAVNLARELGGIGMTGSVTDPEALKSLVQRTLDAYGRIDVVVNNTGDPPAGPLLEITDAQWHQNLDLILLNVIRMSTLVTPIMVGQGGGVIVNISASDAYEPDARFPIGSTFRAALGAWCKLYADQFARHGIRMNCVLPGIVLPTAATDDRQDIRDQVPMRRAGSYEEIAKVVRFLASADASYLTGQNIRVDGGLMRAL